MYLEKWKEFHIYCMGLYVCFLQPVTVLSLRTINVPRVFEVYMSGAEG